MAIDSEPPPDRFAIALAALARRHSRVFERSNLELGAIALGAGLELIERDAGNAAVIEILEELVAQRRPSRRGGT